jgi:hypothetical protein
MIQLNTMTFMRLPWVNTQGEEIVPVRFTELYTNETVGEDIAALVREDDTWAWFDLNGKTLAPDYVRQANAGELQPWCNWDGRTRWLRRPERPHRHPAAF